MLAALFALVVGARGASAQLRPDADWRQIETPHFNIIYEAGLDSIARHAARRAEIGYARLSQELVRAPTGRIDLILADNTDLTNGFATPFPSNRIVIWVRPPVDEPGIQHYTDWIDLVVAHELTHTFHIDQAGKAGRVLRAVFGRVPFAWPFFPVIGVPAWNTEGLATVIESEHTGKGRLYGSYHEMVVRTDVLENAFPPIDRISGESPVWPGGTRAYIYGSLFMDYLARTHGSAAHSRLIERTRGSIVPPTLRLDGVARKALGTSLSESYAEWRARLEAEYRALADSLRAGGLTEGERITTHGRWAVNVRVSPDQQRVAYAEENGRDVASTHIIDTGGRHLDRIRRNGIGALAWLPDDSGLVITQYEFKSRNQIYSDLYVVRNGATTRLTAGARAESPDVSRSGTRVVYVQNDKGTNRLMLRDLGDGSERAVAAASPDVHWTLPRFSPDGTRIAAQLWTRTGGHDVVIIDDRGAELAVIATPGIDAAPAWAPDGRFVVFASDRTGIPNLYAYELASGTLRQVTNVLTGAFYPDVSGDGAWIYYSVYHADGFHVERIPFDPARWREPMPAVARDRVPATDAAAAAVEIGAPRRYAALRSALPRYWLPLTMDESELGTFIGVQTSGADDVGRHSYALGVANEFEHGRVSGFVSYAYAGFGNPVLALSALRDWDYTGRVAVRDTAGEVVDVFGSYEREDRLTLTASLAHRRWRASHSLVLGAEAIGFSRGILGPARFRDPRDELLGVLAGYAFGNVRTPALAISFEDGLRASVSARRRFDTDAGATDRSYTELSGFGALYKSAGGSRFAHDVLALRVSTLHRTGLGRGPTDIGGVVDFLPVRGFEESTRIGFTAWTAALEYRMPLALIARGYRLRPLFVDRVAATFFADAGNAYCTRPQRAVYLSCPESEGRPSGMLFSAGFELRARLAVLVFAPAWYRAGIGFPLSGGAREARAYLTVAPSF